MGNQSSSDGILEPPRIGEASSLYWACRNADVKAVRQILASLPFSDLNKLELNGSTALHAATDFGHCEIVYILLREYGVVRSLKNRHGLTAFHEVSVPQIRQLFERP